MASTAARRVRVVAALLTASFLLSALPTPAGYKSYGEVVDGTTTDKDITHLLLVALAVAPGAEVAFADANLNGAVGTGEGVYIDADGGGAVSALDIRIRAPTGTTGTKGEQVKTTDADCCGTALTAAPGGWAFVDVFPALVGGVCQDAACPDAAVNLGDPIFFDLDASGTVTVSDIKFISRATAATGGVPTTSGSSSIATVTASDTDFGAGLTALAGYALNVFDHNADGAYGFGDHVYVDVDADGLPEPGDIRVNKGAGTAGTMPKAGEKDTVHTLGALGAPGGFLAFDDVNVNGVVGVTEGIYLDVDGSGAVSTNDLRLIGSTGGAGGAQGKQVLSTDADVGLALAAFPGTGFAYNNKNGNGIFDGEDDLYVEVDGDATVEVGDFRVAKSIGGTVTVGQKVTGSASDLTQPLIAFPGGAVLAFYDFNGGGAYNRGDVLFLDVDADGVVSPIDVRIQAGTSPMGTFGEIISDAETEMEYCYDLALAGSTFAYVEESNAGTVDIEEAVYFDRTGGLTVKVHDVRISSGGSGSAGSFVASGASDQNSPLTALANTLSFYDANGDTVYSSKGVDAAGDVIYLDLAGAGTVTAGDVRISKPSVGTGSAGSKVVGGATDLNLVLTGLGAPPVLGVDSDADGSFTSKDALYANVDTALDAGFIAGVALGCVTPADVRLSGTSSGAGGGTGPSPPTPPPTSAPATITISQPTAACVLLNQVFQVAGTANAGTTNGVANTVSSVVVEVEGASVNPTVTGAGTQAASFAGNFTPTAAGSLEITATVTPSSGTARTATKTLTANATCPAAPPPAPPGGIEGQLQQLISQNAQLGSQINSSLAQNNALQQQVVELNTALSNQTGQLTSLNTQLQALQTENTRLQAELARQPEARTPGFEALGALAALGAALLVLRRRA